MIIVLIHLTEQVRIVTVYMYVYNICSIIILYLTEVYYELLEDKVCQFYAELLLRPAGKVSKSCCFSCAPSANTGDRFHHYYFFQ